MQSVVAHCSLATAAANPRGFSLSLVQQQAPPSHLLLRNHHQHHLLLCQCDEASSSSSPRLLASSASPFFLQLHDRLRSSGETTGSRRDGQFCIVATSIATSAPPDLPPSAPPKQEGDIRVVKITDDTISLQGRSLERLKYEIEYGLKRGTTDNSYLVKGQTHTALIDIPDQAFSKAFLKTLATTTDLKRLTYLILGHFSPKRVESLVGLADALGERDDPLQVYCSNPAAQQLKSVVPSDLLEKRFIITVVKADDNLDLGGGHKLQFILTPTPRWPDGMCIYDPATQLIFTNKLFSAHVSEGNGFDLGGWDEYGEDWRFFYDCMLSPVAKQADAVLDKLPLVAQFSTPTYQGKRGIDVIKTDVKFLLSSILSKLNIPISKSVRFSQITGPGDALVTAAICPLHGPIVRSSLTELLREYRVWTQAKLKQVDEATVAVIYASAYGNTAALAQAISRGISKAGVGIESVNAEVCTMEEVAAVMKQCSGFVVGSPTLGGNMPTPVKEALGVILKDDDARSKPCGVFGSLGWSGEAIDEIEQRLKDGGFSFAFPTIRCTFKPTESTLQICEESGTDLAQAVRKAKRKQKYSSGDAQSLVATNVEQAVGRVVGALCVLSAKNGDAESAMLASWVSQASFVPPGITIAVAKERAVEGLVLVGGKFVLNVLGQGKSAAVSKQLLKPFKPGENRFGELPTKQTESGNTILADAIAWMECTVTKRMETGDHWVLYAAVDSGQLQDDRTLTAVHQRKTGARY